MWSIRKLVGRSFAAPTFNDDGAYAREAGPRRRRGPAPRLTAACTALAATALAMLLVSATASAAPTGVASAPPPRSDAANHQLDALVAEAMAHSPLIAAANARWAAANKVPSQVGTLPDPQVTMQEFTVGGPKPSEGYEASDFYYTGIGAEQDIPGPGKLRLAATAAGHDADAARHQFLARQREVAARVLESAFNLFYAAKTIALLEQKRSDLLRIGARRSSKFHRPECACREDCGARDPDNRGRRCQHPLAAWLEAKEHTRR